ncbi:MAG: transposase [Patescibacteria group bacterium]
MPSVEPTTLNHMRKVYICRLPHFDYSSNGYYFVTIVSRLRLPIFAEHEDTVERIFRSVCRDLPGVTIDTMVVMPDHVHCIIVLDGVRLVLGEVIRRMKAKTSYVLGESCWQSNYYEHVIRSEQSLEYIREYIRRNRS